MWAPVQTSAECAGSGNLQFICGVEYAEDAVPLPGTDWLIASGLGLGKGGTLKLVDTRTRSVGELYPAAVVTRQDMQFYRDCPGPPAAATFTAHGLALQPLTAQRYLLYAAHEGDRRSVEVFEVDAAVARPLLVWTGCIVMPDNTNPNAVAALAGRGVAIVSMDDGAADRMQAHANGEARGTLHEWQPASGLQQLGALRLQGGNGIVVSPDQRWWYVSAWSGAELLRFDRGEGGDSLAVTRLALDFLPDNLKWDADGTILVAGQRPPVSRIANCNSESCPADWVLGRIDPSTFTAQELAVATGNDKLNYATGVVQADGAYYITNRGAHRIAVIAGSAIRTDTVLQLDAAGNSE